MTQQPPLYYKGGAIYTGLNGSRFKVKLKNDKKPSDQCSWRAAGHPSDVWGAVLAKFD